MARCPGVGRTDPVRWGALALEGGCEVVRQSLASRSESSEQTPHLQFLYPRQDSGISQNTHLLNGPKLQPCWQLLPKAMGWKGQSDSPRLKLYLKQVPNS